MVDGARRLVGSIPSPTQGRPARLRHSAQPGLVQSSQSSPARGCLGGIPLAVRIFPAREGGRAGSFRALGILQSKRQCVSALVEATAGGWSETVHGHLDSHSHSQSRSSYSTRAGRQARQGRAGQLRHRRAEGREDASLPRSHRIASHRIAIEQSESRIRRTDRQRRTRLDGIIPDERACSQPRGAWRWRSDIAHPAAG